MKNEFVIKKATTEHADEACQVLIRSIKEVCILDHKNDQAVLNEWLSNKTTENLEKWITDTSNYSIVALNNRDEVIGLSMISVSGKILLNYLLPEYLFKGIGKLMLNDMEMFAAKLGLKKIIAMSTITASGFYKRNGFIEDLENKDESCISLMKNI
jgi:N-acetylglutamate synthase-like GNAT family acetyltransferase